MTSEGVLKRKRLNLDLCKTSRLISAILTWEGPRSHAWHVRIGHFSWELLQKHEQSSVSSRGYCIFENCVFRASPQNDFQKCNTLCSKRLLLHISAIPPSWFAKCQVRLVNIARISKSRCFVQSVVHSWKCFCWGALNTPFPKMQYL